MPDMLIVAGCNGAGKTTVTRRFMGTRVGDHVWINPDDTTDGLIALYPEFASDRLFPNLAAAAVSEARADCLIATGRDFVVETVLASKKYLDRAREARRRGMSIRMVYVALETADLAVERVRKRASRGGHDVAPDKVRKRWLSSQENLVEFIPLLSDLLIFDNSDSTEGNPVVPFASLSGRTLTAHIPTGLAHLRAVVRKAAAGSGFVAVGF